MIPFGLLTIFLRILQQINAMGRSVVENTSSVGVWNQSVCYHSISKSGFFTWPPDWHLFDFLSCLSKWVGVVHVIRRLNLDPLDLPCLTTNLCSIVYFIPLQRYASMRICVCFFLFLTEDLNLSLCILSFDCIINLSCVILLTIAYRTRVSKAYVSPMAKRHSESKQA